MAVTRQQKEETLAHLIDQLQKAKSVVFSQYQGLNVKGMRALRKKLTENKVSFKVARKTLMSLAAKKVGFEQIPESFLKGPIGLAFSMQDEIAGLKIIHGFGKEHEQVKIVGAIFEGKLIDEASAKMIAALPSKEVLIAQFVGMLKSPIAGFHGVLHSIMRSFVYALSEVQKKKAAAPQ